MSAVRHPFEPALLRSELLEIRSAVANATPNDEDHDEQGGPVANATPQSASWLTQAACKGRPTNFWYPARGDVFGTAVAQAICRSCPVRRECLEDALAFEADLGLSVGIRAGTSARERTLLLRRRLRR